MKCIKDSWKVILPYEDAYYITASYYKPPWGPDRVNQEIWTQLKLPVILTMSWTGVTCLVVLHFLDATDCHWGQRLKPLSTYWDPGRGQEVTARIMTPESHWYTPEAHIDYHRDIHLESESPVLLDLNYHDVTDVVQCGFKTILIIWSEP